LKSWTKRYRRKCIEKELEVIVLMMVSMSNGIVQIQNRKELSIMIMILTIFWMNNRVPSKII